MTSHLLTGQVEADVLDIKARVDADATAQRRFAMSVDVEDYLHTWALSPVIQRNAWDRWPSRVEAATMRIVDLFDRHEVRATFFIARLGRAAGAAAGARDRRPRT